MLVVRNKSSLLTDLLRPTNRGLPVSISMEEGVHVSSLHVETIVDEMELRRSLADACGNRAVHTQPLGGSIDTSTAVFEFKLYQSEGAASLGFGAGRVNPDAIRTCRSRLLVVDLPSVDPLVVGGAVDVRSLEGLTLHRSLLSFVDVCKKISNPTRAPVAPFRSSTLTHYLSELLGGNAIVVALGSLTSGEPQVSRKTLELLHSLSAAMHYPIGGKEITEVLQGLLSKYRSMVIQMEDVLEEVNNSKNSNQEQERTLEKQLIELQKDLATAMIEKNEAVEDRERLFEMVELLKAKYATVMEEKSKQSADFASALEDKVALAKELMEQQLEHSRVVEELEKEKFELSSDLVASKESVRELEGRVTALLEELDKASKDLFNSGETVNQLKKEIEKLVEEVDRRQAIVEKEKERNVELGAELLTLVNHRDVISGELEELKNVHDRLKKDMSEEIDREKRIEGLVHKYEEEMKAKEEELLSLKKANNTLDIENQRMKLTVSQMEFENSKNELKEGNGSNASLLSNRSDIDGKRSNRVIRDLEKVIKRTQADLAATSKEKGELERELNDLREKYRTKLSSLLAVENRHASHHHHYSKQHRHRHGHHDSIHEEEENPALDEIAVHPEGQHPIVLNEEADATKLGSENLRATSRKSFDAKKMMDAAAAALRESPDSTSIVLQRQLIDSYIQREEANRVQLDASLQQRSILLKSYRELYDKYRELMDVLEENIPRANHAKVKILEERLMVEEQQVRCLNTRVSHNFAFNSINSFIYKL